MGAADMEITLVTNNSKVRYVGDGARVEFAYDFNPIDLNYVKVYKNLVEVNSPDITVSPGVVTFEVAPLAGDTIVIMRDMPLTYEKGIVSKGIINSDSLDNLAVELLGQIQQVNEKLSRTPTYPLDTSLTGEEIFSEFNQNVQSVKDAKDIVDGKVEEVNSAVSSGLNEITETTSESQTAITENKNNAISEIQSTTEGLIQRAETAAEEAETSAQDAASSANLANIQNKISNCITKIPQDIKLELNNGTLTLKAGSKVYDGNGLLYTLTSDITYTYKYDRNGSMLLIYKRSNGNYYFGVALGSETVDSIPTQQEKPDYIIKYCTANKKCYYQDKSGFHESSFPICLFSSTTNDGFTSIDQVFNGFGYIGSTIFALPGVEGLIPNGRNADGILNNTKFTVDKVLITTNLGSSDFRHLCIYPDMTFAHPMGVYYDEEENICKETERNTSGFCIVGGATFNMGKVASFNSNLPIKLADTNSANTFDNVNTFISDGTANSPIRIKLKDDDISVNPSSEKFAVMAVVDKNDKVMGEFWIGHRTDGAVYSQLVARNSNGDFNNLAIGVFANGVKFTLTSTPDVSSNSQAIATTSWVRTFLGLIYPVGSVYITTAGTCPLQAIGIGTWKNIGTSLTLNVNTNVPVKGTGGTILLKQIGGNIQNNLRSRAAGYYLTNGLYIGNDGPGFTGDVSLTTDSSRSGMVGTVTRTQITVNVFQRIA